MDGNRPCGKPAAETALCVSRAARCCWVNSTSRAPRLLPLRLRLQPPLLLCHGRLLQSPPPSPPPGPAPRPPHPHLALAAELLQGLLEGVEGAVGEHAVLPPLVKLNQATQVSDLARWAAARRQGSMSASTPVCSMPWMAALAVQRRVETGRYGGLGQCSPMPGMPSKHLCKRPPVPLPPILPHLLALAAKTFGKVLWKVLVHVRQALGLLLRAAPGACRREREVSGCPRPRRHGAACCQPSARRGQSTASL
jgi:hypothetical protein